MKKNLLIFILALLINNNLYPETQIVKRDNGVPRTAYQERAEWEESVILQPDGPCEILEIQIYFAGETEGKDTIFIVGDAGEGVMPPTFWVLPYNTIYEPIYFDYDGRPGWRSFEVPGLRAEGSDRIVIQHKLSATGPWFAIDNDGYDEPYSSYIMDPTTENSYGWPGNTYLASGDYLVRLLVEYDYQYDDGSSYPLVPPTMVDVSIEAGITNSEGAIIKGQSVSIADINNDGYDDICMNSNVFINNTDGTFRNATEELALQGTPMWADYDNDGDLDAYCLIGGTMYTDEKFAATQNTIFRNNGDGTFERLNQTDVFMLPYPNPSEDFDLDTKYDNDSIHNPYVCWGPVWFDYNGDGNTDLYLGNRRSVGSYPGEVFNPDVLWENNGDGTFKNVSEETGIAEQCKHIGGESRNQDNLYFNGQDAAACDFNMDNKIDLQMINYGLERDFLYVNNGDGTYTDVAGDKGTNGFSPLNPNPDASTHGHSTEWADFNNDGYPDVCVGNLAHPDWRGLFSNPSMIYKNLGPDADYAFEEVHHPMGLRFYESVCGVVWLDLDLDGWQDLWHGQRYDKMSHLYLNMGGPDCILREITWTTGCETYDCWSAARLDFDNDGDLDLFIKGSLYRNDLERKGNWLGIRLKGSPEDGITMDCFGTKAVIYSGDKLFYRELMGTQAGPLHRQNTNELHFGLGDIETIDSLIITYQNGVINKITENIEVNNKYLIEYNSQPQILMLPAPGLVYPANYHTDIETECNFQWTKCGNADAYEIIVAIDREFADIVFTQSEISNLNYLQTLPNNNTHYYWKVRAFSGEDMSPWSSTWTFYTGIPLASQPVLVSPENNSEDLSVLTAFSWNEIEYFDYVVPNTKYEFAISDSDNFDSENTTVIEDLSALQISPEGPLQADTKYFWRVRATNWEEPGPWSEVYNFTTAPLPEAPVLLTPADKEEEVDDKPKFTWEEVDYADIYHLQVSRDELFSDLHFEKEDVKIAYHRMLSPKCDEGRTYYWRVRAVNDGGESDWSAVNSFVVEGELAVDDAGYPEISLEITPNPVQDFANIILNINKSGNYSISIINASGAEVEKIANKYLETGTSKFKWHTTEFPQGMYYCKVIHGNSVFIEPLILVK